jgi:hypothetical protein
MVYLQTKNPNFGKFWRVIECKMLIYFMSIWNNLPTVGIFYDNLVHFVLIWYTFSRFGIKYQEKSGNPFLTILKRRAEIMFSDKSTFAPWHVAWHSGHRVLLQNWRSRVRIPPGCEGARFLGLYTLQCCCQNLMFIFVVYIWGKIDFKQKYKIKYNHRMWQKTSIFHM